MGPKAPMEWLNHTDVDPESSFAEARISSVSTLSFQGHMATNDLP